MRPATGGKRSDGRKAWLAHHHTKAVFRQRCHAAPQPKISERDKPHQQATVVVCLGISCTINAHPAQKNLLHGKGTVLHSIRGGFCVWIRNHQESWKFDWGADRQSHSFAFAKGIHGSRQIRYSRLKDSICQVQQFIILSRTSYWSLLHQASLTPQDRLTFVTWSATEITCIGFIWAPKGRTFFSFISAIGARRSAVQLCW